MAKGEHRPHEGRAKKNRARRKAATTKIIEAERQKVKSVLAAAAEPDASYLERRAMVQGWAVPAWQQPELIDNQVRMALDPDGNPRNRIAAFKALLAADVEARKRELGLDKPVPGQVNVGVQVNGGSSDSHPFMPLDSDEAHERINFIAAQAGQAETRAVPSGGEDPAGEEPAPGPVLDDAFELDESA